MAETGIKSFKRNIVDAFVAFLAVAFNGKSGGSIMAGATGKALFHLFHGAGSTVGPGNKKFIVAVPATERHIQVKLVAEKSVAGHGNFRGLMAFDAVPFY